MYVVDGCLWFFFSIESKQACFQIPCVAASALSGEGEGATKGRAAAENKQGAGPAGRLLNSVTQGNLAFPRERAFGAF